MIASSWQECFRLPKYSFLPTSRQAVTHPQQEQCEDYAPAQLSIAGEGLLGLLQAQAADAKDPLTSPEEIGRCIRAVSQRRVEAWVSSDADRCASAMLGVADDASDEDSPKLARRGLSVYKSGIYDHRSLISSFIRSGKVLPGAFEIGDLNEGSRSAAVVAAMVLVVMVVPTHISTGTTIHTRPREAQLLVVLRGEVALMAATTRRELTAGMTLPYGHRHDKGSYPPRVRQRYAVRYLFHRATRHPDHSLSYGHTVMLMLTSALASAMLMMAVAVFPREASHLRTAAIVKGRELRRRRPHKPPPPPLQRQKPRWQQEQQGPRDAHGYDHRTTMEIDRREVTYPHHHHITVMCVTLTRPRIRTIQACICGLSPLPYNLYGGQNVLLRLIRDGSGVWDNVAEATGTPLPLRPLTVAAAEEALAALTPLHGKAAVRSYLGRTAAPAVAATALVTVVVVALTATWTAVFLGDCVLRTATSPPSPWGLPGHRGGSLTRAPWICPPADTRHRMVAYRQLTRHGARPAVHSRGRRQLIHTAVQEPYVVLFRGGRRAQCTPTDITGGGGGGGFGCSGSFPPKPKPLLLLLLLRRRQRRSGFES
ncbi:hypothetical protein VOLCADRAFT_88111 [Volvox carteri f. nagariensis]|uniref:Uncharacterized protein n=1 Tax=Volvox carteri f. nagariensis TaxID=3068 RepID=D8TN39_VOLCA|nr:uncharacterized protein VOLCADRAFT_88111 [Volvox carteri f. nagariensis]EFJ51237.1 hypothetical protein VOLCADRAFT_88111 [Volvox carteri f. nagariensis]|eukprot:XP_002947704.1 hypothetical protein VOLCADRAFT_88111 [Volvox carteri f. nagariensis]